MLKNIKAKIRPEIRRTLLIIFVVLSFSLFLGKVQAGSTDNTRGWAWTDTIGWLSFNSINCDGNGDGFSDGTPDGCPSIGTPIANYGVNINPSAGNFSGLYSNIYKRTGDTFTKLYPDVYPTGYTHGVSFSPDSNYLAVADSVGPYISIYNRGATLTAIPDASSAFAGWSGDADCLDGIVTMDANKSCTATFDSLGCFIWKTCPTDCSGTAGAYYFALNQSCVFQSNTIHWVYGGDFNIVSGGYIQMDDNSSFTFNAGKKITITGDDYILKSASNTKILKQ